MTRRVELPPPGLRYFAAEPIRWGKVATICTILAFACTILSGISYAAYHAGTVETKVDQAQSDIKDIKGDVAYLRERMDGAPPSPKLPMTVPQATAPDTFGNLAAASKRIHR